MDQGSTEVATTPAPASAQAKPDGWLRGKLRSFHAQKDAVRQDPLWGTVFVIVVAVATWGANEAWGQWKESHRDPDKQLLEIQATQEKEFAELHKNLKALGNALPSANRDDLKQIRDAIGGIEAQNKSLVGMLALAREENERMRQLAEAKTGVRGGYDLLLTENAGIQLDAVNQLGVSDVSANYVRANLTGRSGTQRKNLDSGESIAYEGADGRQCRATVLSISDRRAASFAISCG